MFHCTYPTPPKKSHALDVQLSIVVNFFFWGVASQRLIFFLASQKKKKMVTQPFEYLYLFASIIFSYALAVNIWSLRFLGVLRIFARILLTPAGIGQILLITGAYLAGDMFLYLVRTIAIGALPIVVRIVAFYQIRYHDSKQAQHFMYDKFHTTNGITVNHLVEFGKMLLQNQSNSYHDEELPDTGLLALHPGHVRQTAREFMARRTNPSGMAFCVQEIVGPWVPDLEHQCCCGLPNETDNV